MNYIGLISLVLGLISIIITIKYVDNYDKLHYILKKQCSSKKIVMFPPILVDIQNKLNVTDSIFIDSLEQNKAKIIDIMNKSGEKTEQFSNYMPYISSEKRSIYKKDLSGIIKSTHQPKKITQFKFVDSIALAKKAISFHPKYAEYNRHIKIKDTADFNKRNMCLVTHGNTNYCFSTSEKEFCPGIYGKNFNECKDKRV